MTSKFYFLKSSYPELFTISELSEKLIHIDPSSSLAKSRLFSEKLAVLIWKFEELGFFDGNQVDRIRQLSFKDCIPDVIKDILHSIRKSGNKASHDGSGSQSEALFILKKCFQLSRWFYETYENEYIETSEYQLPEDNQQISFDKLNAELDRLSGQVIDYQTKIEAINATPEIIVERKQRSIKNANNIRKTEAETRELIDE